MATKCDPIRSQLHALEELLKTTPKYANEPAQGENRSLTPEWTNLDSHVRKTRMSLQVCEDTD